MGLEPVAMGHLVNLDKETGKEISRLKGHREDVHAQITVACWELESFPIIDEVSLDITIPPPLFKTLKGSPHLAQCSCAYGAHPLHGCEVNQ